MNKTIIININGTVFHIEESAYEVLKEYMTDVKRHFFNSADSLEITTDIENRIAEMFTEILIRENRQALIEQDVQHVIEQMGSVKDFEIADDEDAAGYTTSSSAYSSKTVTGQRRLFRDPDNHLVGGVCAGIASYFDTQATWIRLAFAITIVFAGTGLFLYIILWIILPKAVTRADRMAMKGEPLDLQGFKRNFEAEMSMVGGKLTDLHQEARPLIYQTRDFIGDFFHHLGVFLGGTGKILVKLLGIAIILACAGCIIALIVALVMAWVFGESQHFALPINFFEYHYINQVYIAVSLLCIIPLVSLIILIASAVFNTSNISRSTGYTLLAVWIMALIVLAYHGARVATDFRESAGFTQTIDLKPAKNQVYHLKLNETMFLTPEDSARLDIKHRFENMILTDDRDYDNAEPRSVTIDIEKADINYPVLVEEFTARGRNYETALDNARSSRYIFIQQDSVLKFDYKLRRKANEPWHMGWVHITLKIPMNASVVVDDPINGYISNYLNVWDCNQANNREKGPATFTMTDDGLQCKVDTSAIKARPLKKEATAKTDTTLVVDTVDVVDTAHAPVPAPATSPVKHRKVIRRHYYR